MSLQSHRVVIIGGSSGIGHAVADAAATAGADVHIISSQQSSIDAALKTLPAGVRGAVADVRDSESVQAAYDAIGSFDHLVYTAGEALYVTNLTDYNPDTARDFFDIRLFRALDAARLAVPHLRDGGSITFTSGTGAFRPGPGWSVTGAVLNAVVAATKALALELAPLRINAVAPGVTRSPLWRGMSDADQQDLYTSVGEGLPLGRVAELPEVAAEYLHLMQQPYATGVVSVIDGGTLL